MASQKLQPYKVLLEQRKVDYTETETEIITQLRGVSDIGHKFTIRLVIEELPEGVFGYCTGAGDDLFQVDPQTALKAFFARKVIFAHEIQ